MNLKNPSTGLPLLYEITRITRPSSPNKQKLTGHPTAFRMGDVRRGHFGRGHSIVQTHGSGTSEETFVFSTAFSFAIKRPSRCSVWDTLPYNGRLFSIKRTIKSVSSTLSFQDRYHFQRSKKFILRWLSCVLLGGGINTIRNVQDSRNQKQWIKIFNLLVSIFHTKETKDLVYLFTTKNTLA